VKGVHLRAHTYRHIRRMYVRGGKEGGWGGWRGLSWRGEERDRQRERQR